MKPPFQPGDFVIYKDDEFNRGPTKIIWCGLGRDCVFIKMDKVWKDQYIVVYEESEGFDPVKYLRKFTKLDQVLK